MRLYLLAFIFFISTSVLYSCSTTHTNRNSGKVPPGKAKKIYGTKSAKPFAPGQKKKKGKKHKDH
jgi:hypothetical protein